MKDLKKLKGAKTISKNEQRSIKGGIINPRRCSGEGECPPEANCCTSYTERCGVLNPYGCYEL